MVGAARSRVQAKCPRVQARRPIPLAYPPEEWYRPERRVLAARAPQASPASRRFTLNIGSVASARVDSKHLSRRRNLDNTPRASDREKRMALGLPTTRAAATRAATTRAAATRAAATRAAGGPRPPGLGSELFHLRNAVRAIHALDTAAASIGVPGVAVVMPPGGIRSVATAVGQRLSGDEAAAAGSRRSARTIPRGALRGVWTALRSARTRAASFGPPGLRSVPPRQISLRRRRRHGGIKGVSIWCRLRTPGPDRGAAARPGSGRRRMARPGSRRSGMARIGTQAHGPARIEAQRHGPARIGAPGPDQDASLVSRFAGRWRLPDSFGQELVGGLDPVKRC